MFTVLFKKSEFSVIFRQPERLKTRMIDSLSLLFQEYILTFIIIAY